MVIKLHLVLSAVYFLIFIDFDFFSNRFDCFAFWMVAGQVKYIILIRKHASEYELVHEVESRALDIEFSHKLLTRLLGIVREHLGGELD